MNWIQLTRVFFALGIYAWLLVSTFYHAYTLTIGQTMLVLYAMAAIGTGASLFGWMTVAKKHASRFAGKFTEARKGYYKVSFVWQGLLWLCLGLLHTYYVRTEHYSVATLPLDIFLMALSYGGLFLVLLLAFGIEYEIFRALRAPVLIRPMLLRKSGGYWTLLATALMIFVSANYLFAHFNVGKDLSVNRWGKMSPETLQLAQDSKYKFEVFILYPHGHPFRTMARHYMAPMEGLEQAKIIEADFRKSPDLQKKLRQGRNGFVVIMREDGRMDKVEIGLEMNSSAQMRMNDFDKNFNLALKNILLDKSVVGFTWGNGEYSVDVDDANPSDLLVEFFRNLEEANYGVLRIRGNKWDMVDSRGKTVWDEINALFIVGPSQRFSEEQVAKIEAFVASGKDVFLFLEPGRTPLKENPLTSWLGGLGMKLGSYQVHSPELHHRISGQVNDYRYVITNGPAELKSWGRGIGRVMILDGPSYFENTDKLNPQTYAYITGFSVEYPMLYNAPKSAADLGISGIARASVLIEQRKDAVKDGEKRRGRVYAFADANFLTDPVVSESQNAHQMITLLDSALDRRRSSGRYYSSKYDRLVTIGSGGRAWMTYVVFSLIPLVWVIWGGVYFYLIAGRRKAEKEVNHAA